MYVCIHIYQALCSLLSVGKRDRGQSPQVPQSLWEHVLKVKLGLEDRVEFGGTWYTIC